MTGALYSDGQLSLMTSAGTGYARGMIFARSDRYLLSLGTSL